MQNSQSGRMADTIWVYNRINAAVHRQAHDPRRTQRIAIRGTLRIAQMQMQIKQIHIQG